MCTSDTVSANTSLQKRGGRTITTRHYLDFINHYVSLCVDLWSVLWSVVDWFDVKSEWSDYWLLLMLLLIFYLLYLFCFFLFLSLLLLSPSSLSPSLIQVKPYTMRIKRQDLLKQQLHLNVGLHKIRETVDHVEELQASQWARALSSMYLLWGDLLCHLLFMHHLLQFLMKVSLVLDGQT